MRSFDRRHRLLGGQCGRRNGSGSRVALSHWADQHRVGEGVGATTRAHSNGDSRHRHHCTAADYCEDELDAFTGRRLRHGAPKLLAIVTCPLIPKSGRLVPWVKLSPGCELTGGHVDVWAIGVTTARE